MSAEITESFGYLDTKLRTINQPSYEPSLYLCRRLVAYEGSEGRKWLLEVTKRLQRIGEKSVESALWRYPIPSITMADCVYGVVGDTEGNKLRVPRIAKALSQCFTTEQYDLSPEVISIDKQGGNFYGYQIAIEDLDDEMYEVSVVLQSHPDANGSTLKPIRNAHITIARPSRRLEPDARLDVGAQIEAVLVDLPIDTLVLDRPELSYWL